MVVKNIVENRYAVYPFREMVLLLAEGDTPISAMTLPKGTIVEKVLVRIMSAAYDTPNGGITLTVGDDDDADGFIPASSALATAGTIYGDDPTERGAYLYDSTKKGSFSKWYESDKTLKFALSAEPDTRGGEYEVIVLGFRTALNPLVADYEPPA